MNRPCDRYNVVAQFKAGEGLGHLPTWAEVIHYTAEQPPLFHKGSWRACEGTVKRYEITNAAYNQAVREVRRVLGIREGEPPRDTRQEQEAQRLLADKVAEMGTLIDTREAEL